WQAPLMDEEVGSDVGERLAGMDALLLGRRTYDIFAAYWPDQEDGVDGSIATQLNSVPKYIASRSTPELDWSGSQLLGPDLAGDIREARDRHAEIHVIGSLDLVQTLLSERLVDRLNLWVYPIVLGVGKKVFAGGAVPTSLSLAGPPVASASGAVLLRYDVAEGEPATGDMTQPDRSA
ncbi:MAG: dihydrofolate reductase family protein, partial [Aeromicrobium sp.]